jgi:hypothetical protein
MRIDPAAAIPPYARSRWLSAPSPSAPHAAEAHRQVAVAAGALREAVRALSAAGDAAPGGYAPELVPLRVEVGALRRTLLALLDDIRPYTLHAPSPEGGAGGDNL